MIFDLSLFLFLLLLLLRDCTTVNTGCRVWNADFRLARVSDRQVS
jgi:hypothetical protein